MHPNRRAALAALAAGLPLVGDSTASASAGPPPGIRLVPFEEAVRDAFRTSSPNPVRRVAVGWCDLVRGGLQGYVNCRACAGFSPGRLRIIRTGFEPGPVVGGVRLFVATVDLILTHDGDESSSRQLDFATLPPAPALTGGVESPHSPRRTGGTIASALSAG